MSRISGTGLFFHYIAQVLTGEVPFRGIWQGKLVSRVVEGQRPDKPENAPSIGFSDLLWSFVQRCWDEDSNLRPKVAEVMACLENAVANWDGLMPRHVPKGIPSDLEESDSMKHCELKK